MSERFSVSPDPCDISKLQTPETFQSCCNSLSVGKHYEIGAIGMAAQELPRVPGGRAGVRTSGARKRGRQRPKERRWPRAWSWARSSPFGSGAEDVVPVAPLDGRAKPHEWDPEFFGQRSVAVCEAVARSIGVRSAAEKRAGEHCDPGEQRLERSDRPRSHAAARRGVERVPAEALDRRDAQRINRRLSENQPRKRWTLRGQAEERFGAPCQRTFVGRSAHIDMGDDAVTIEMGKPGAAARPFPQNAGRRRRLDDRGGEPALSREIPPGRRIGPNGLALGPAFGGGPPRVISPPCPYMRRDLSRGRDAGERNRCALSRDINDHVFGGLATFRRLVVRGMGPRLDRGLRPRNLISGRPCLAGPQS